MVSNEQNLLLCIKKIQISYQIIHKFGSQVEDFTVIVWCKQILSDSIKKNICKVTKQTEL